MDIKEFDKFVEFVLINAPDDRREEYYGTHWHLLNILLADVKSKAFAEVIVENLEREELARLIAKYGVPE